MRIVVVLAVAALVSLVLALVTGNIFAAIAVVLLALAGIVLLVRDWRAADPSAAAEPDDQPVADEDLLPDEHSPDIAAADKF